MATNTLVPAPDPVVRPPDPTKLGLRRTLPVCETWLNGKELEYLTECLESNWISSAGDFVGRFERSFADAVGCEHGVSCSSGTAALHLALTALGIGAGDEVIIPAFTMIAVPNAVTYTRATPVLVDVEPATWNLDPVRVLEKVTPRTRAIIAVHTYGHPADLTVLTELAAEHGLYLVEDAAEAHGATWEGKPVGGIGAVGCFSFYGNKIVSTGEGGMVTTKNQELADRLRLLRDHGVSRERHFWHQEFGFNYRMSNLEAAVGLAQTERLEVLIEARHRNARCYTEALRGIPGLRLPIERGEARSAFWVYALLIDTSFGCSRDLMRKRLADSSIETRSLFIPIHLQPFYRNLYSGERYPVAEDLCSRGLYLPSGPTLTTGEIAFVAEQVAASRNASCSG